MLTRSGWLVLLGAALAVAIGRVFGAVELYIVAVGLVLLLLFALLRVRIIRIDVAVSRRLEPLRVRAGQPAKVALEVINHRLRATPVLGLYDPVSSTSGANLLLAPIAAESGAVSAYRLPTAKRGVVNIGPLEIVIADPFHLAHNRIEAAASAELIVLPAIVDLAPPRRTSGVDPAEGGRKNAVQQSSGDEFSSLRDYVVGDDLRRVHWKSTARRGELIVRQDESHHRGQTTIWLDTRVTSHDTATFEPSVTAAASILESAWRRGDHLRLLIGAEWDSNHLGTNVPSEFLAEALARAQITSATDFAVTAAQIGRQTGNLIVVSGLPTLADITAVGRHIRHLCIVGRGQNLATLTTTGDHRLELIALDDPAGFGSAWNRQYGQTQSRQPALAYR